ncbi:MAG TPA: sulfatase-like hydrolase/transferase, partial [Candidatus Polarisedimenticolia bacterium]|nr:sulfatase-like hydrolase/transferase [Candidatus Polarisedimenticolia bacterium]
RGFDHYDDRFDRLQTARARLFSRTALFRWMHRAGLFTDRDLDFQRIAPEVNARVVSWLESRAGGRPYFLFVHYWDPHGPYAPPAPLDRRADGSRIEVDYDMDRLLEGVYTLSPSGLADTLELYDREIQYVDGHVGALIDVLRDRGELDNAVIVLTSDHGESFGEHDHWEHSRVLYEDLLHVPFLLRLPGGRAAGTVVRDAIAQPTDILPTVLSAAGLPMPEELEGRDLLAALGDDGSGGREAHPGVRDLQFAFAELDRNVDWPARWGARYDRDLTSVRTLRYKYIQSSTGREELYDLQTDPGETIDQAASMPDSVASMRALVMLWRKSMKERGASDAGGEVDEGLKESLRGLGYIQ